MDNIEQKRKEFDLFLASKDFKLTDSEVIEKAIQLEKSIEKTQVI